MDMIQSYIELAELDGKREYGLLVLDLYCKAIREGKSPDSRIMDYLARSFDKIINDDEVAQKALNITKTKGRSPDSSTLKKHFRLAAYMVDLMEAGASYYDAKAQVAKERHQSEGTVKEAYDDLAVIIKDRLAYEQNDAKNWAFNAPKNAQQLVDEYMLF